jgi:hypothetical protein
MESDEWLAAVCMKLTVLLQIACCGAVTRKNGVEKRGWSKPSSF